MTVKLMIAPVLGALILAGCNPPKPGELRAEEVKFKGAEGAELPGTLLIPAQTPAPFVILFPGSGPTDRNGNQLPHVNTDLLKQIAEHLQKQGIGSLRYDKRVTPKVMIQAPPDSKKLPQWMSWSNHKEDALAAVDFLKKRPEVKEGKIALIGHSEGGLQTLAIGKDAAPAAIVLLATPGRPLEEILRAQIIAALIRQAPPATVRDEYISEVDRLIKEVKMTGKTTSVPQGLQTLFNPMTDRFLQDMFRENPLTLAGQLPCPTLVMNGESDIQISPTEDAPLLLTALKGRPNGKQDMSIIPGVSHNFKPVKDLDKDPGLEGPLPPAMLDRLAKWLKENL